VDGHGKQQALNRAVAAARRKEDGLINYGLIARERRQQLGLSQRQVAKKSGCDPRTVRAFENGERGLGMDYVVAIYKTLGLRLEVKG